MFKRFSLFAMMIFVLLSSLVSCKRSIDYSRIVSEKPDQSIRTGDYDLDFVAMHNYVIDYLSSELMPFFFVKEGSFDIDGDNTSKVINVKCTCMNGTVVYDLDLFLSMVLNGIALNASEQDFRFKRPTVDTDGTFLDFGNVFDTYTLNIYADLENKEILRNDSFKPGDKITIDPRYIKE